MNAVSIMKFILCLLGLAWIIFAEDLPLSTISEIQKEPDGWPAIPFAYAFERMPYLSLVFINKGQQGDNGLKDRFRTMLQKKINQLGPNPENHAGTTYLEHDYTRTRSMACMSPLRRAGTSNSLVVQ